MAELDLLVCAVHGMPAALVKSVRAEHDQVAPRYRDVTCEFEH